MRTLIVTGANGFLGRSIAEHFVSLGWKVTGIDRVSPADGELQRKGVDFHRMDVVCDELHDLIAAKRPQALVHAAGPASVAASFEEPKRDFQEGVLSLFNVLHSLHKGTKDCRVVFLSSAAVYGNPLRLPVKEDDQLSPISPYGHHKLVCENLLKEFFQVFGVACCAVRIFSAYGPGLRRQVIWDICTKALREDVVTLQGTGRESRDFIHAQDVAKGLAAVIENAPMKAEAYNLGTGKEVAIETLARLVADAVGPGRSLRFDRIIPPGVPINWQADMTRLSSLGFAPAVELKEGIADTVRWCLREVSGVQHMPAADP